MDWRQKAKKDVAKAAVAHVEEGHVIGLGSGTTVAYALRELGKRIKREKLHVLGVPTSHQAFLLAVEHKIPLTTLDEHPRLDVVVDGADQVDERLDMIKGMGGALTREKVVASASRLNIIVVDETKLTKALGTKHPVPVEVVPFALPLVRARLRSLRGKAVLREGAGKLGPVVTDNCNFILDVAFGLIDDPNGLDLRLKAIPGVVETGLFVGLADVVYVGGRKGVRRLVK